MVETPRVDIFSPFLPDTRPSGAGESRIPRDGLSPEEVGVFRTVVIFVLLGAILGAVAASFIAPPLLGWYNEAGFLSQTGQVQSLVNLPQIIRYTTDRLLKAQLVGAGLGAFTFLILGLYASSRSRRRAREPVASAAKPGV
jgi:hypothetical protein